MKQKRVAGYLRVSTMEQVLEGTSIDTQKEKIALECKKRGWNLYKFYNDGGISGKSVEKRPGLQRLLSDAESKKFDAVMFTNIDRLARNNRELLNIAHDIRKEYQLDFICVDVPWIDSQSDFSDAMLSIFGAFAEFERKQIRARTESGRFNKWKNLEAFIGQPPYGYKYDKKLKTMVEIKEKREVYDLIVSLYLDQGYGMQAIANELTNRREPTPSSYRWKKRKAQRWNAHTIRRILMDPAYKGEATYNKFEHLESKGKKHYTYQSKEEKPSEVHITISFPPFIPKDRWDEIQKKREFHRNKVKKPFKGYENHYLAVNVIQCGECGGSMIKVKPRQKKDGTATAFRYRCYWKNTTANKLATAGRKRCILKTLDAEMVDQKIFDKVVEVIADPFQFAEKWFIDQNLSELKSRRDRIANAINDREKEVEKDRQFVKFLENEVAIKKHAKKMDKDQQELSNMQDELQEVEDDINSIDNKVDRLEQFKKSIESATGIFGYGSTVEKHPQVTEIEAFLYDLPFDKKKTIVESVIGPKHKCSIRYQRQIDLYEPDDREEIEYEYLVREILGEDRREIAKRDNKPLMDREPDIDMGFYVDLQKVESVISRLLNKEFLDKIGG